MNHQGILDGIDPNTVPIFAFKLANVAAQARYNLLGNVFCCPVNFHDLFEAQGYLELTVCGEVPAPTTA